MSARVAVIGDLHGQWDDWDTRYFSQSDYDLVLVTGDLGSGSSDNGVRIARSLGRMSKRALVMPGNNDVARASQIAAELGHQRGLSSLLRARATTTGQVHLCGYSLHEFELAGQRLSVLAARPYSRGGPELAYVEQLGERFGVYTMEQSTRKLCALIDRCDSEALLVLAHNGPTGFGGRATDPWGRDFTPEPCDWGDPDLAQALAHARANHKRVLAVIAGHMHRQTRGGEDRDWLQRRDGTLYLNAARVPRICERHDGKYRHHVALELGPEVEARELWLREPD